MKRLNIGAPEFAYDPDDPEGFKAGMLRAGPLLDARQLGASVYELPPGQAICPYHYEYGDEEWLLVIEGHPTLRTPDGEAQIGPWEVAFFPQGPDGAHRVYNRTNTTVRVLMFSTRAEVAACVYPDSGKIGIFTPNRDDNLLVRQKHGVGYYDGELPAAD